MEGRGTVGLTTSWSVCFGLSDSSSQIDYFFLSQHSELNEVASIEDMHYLNISDHTHITLKSHIHLERLTQTNPKDETPKVLKPRIRWNKCDPNEYHSYTGVLKTHLIRTLFQI